MEKYQEILLYRRLFKYLGRECGIDIIATTHNPALLDAAGSRMVPFIAVAHRNIKTGVSLLSQLEEIRQLPKLMASGTLGRLSMEGRIELALKQQGDV